MVMVVAGCTTFALSVDARQYRTWLQVHDNALVEKLIDDQDYTTHVFNQALPLNALSKDPIEALMHTIEQLAQDQLIVIDMPNNENCHVRIASENGHIVVYGHNVVFEAIGRG